MKFVSTADGSKTLFHPEIGEHYHSMHGAVQESRHVFLKSGLQYFLEQAGNGTQEAAILEVGFGTGLNFLLSAEHCLQAAIRLVYCGIEAYPLNPEFLAETDYQHYVRTALWDNFLNCYPASLLAPVFVLPPSVSLEIKPVKALDFDHPNLFDILYFDAFAAVHQPEMWTSETLAHVCRFLKPGGVFVTYAITGNLKRCMKELGFRIEKAPGAPGKREMLRATFPSV